MFTRRFDEEVAMSKKAGELDPVSIVGNADEGNILYFAKRYDESIEQIKRTLYSIQSSPVRSTFLATTTW